MLWLFVKTILYFKYNLTLFNRNLFLPRWRHTGIRWCDSGTRHIERRLVQGLDPHHAIAARQPDTVDVRHAGWWWRTTGGWWQLTTPLGAPRNPKTQHQILTNIHQPPCAPRPRLRVFASTKTAIPHRTPGRTHLLGDPHGICSSSISKPSLPTSSKTSAKNIRAPKTNPTSYFLFATTNIFVELIHPWGPDHTLERGYRTTFNRDTQRERER